MCKELDVGLQNGKDLATALCQHLVDMGGVARCSIPVELNGYKYSVVTELIGKVRETDFHLCPWCDSRRKQVERKYRDRISSDVVVKCSNNRCGREAYLTLETWNKVKNL